MLIRRALRQDDAELGRVHSQAWHETYPGLVSRDYLDFLTPERSQTIFTHRAPANTFVWEEAGKIVGFAVIGHARGEGVSPRTGELCGLYVLKDFQGKGGGHALLTAAQNRLKELGYRHMILWVLEANQKARRFYERNGLRPDGTVQYPDLGGAVAEIRMRKELE